MNIQPRILLMSASIGSGHLRAAEALYGELKERFPKGEIHQVDFMDKNVAPLMHIIKGIYLRLLKFLPNIYDVFYRLAGKNSAGVLVNKIFARLNLSPMEKLLVKYRPNIIICTHPFPEGAAALAKRKNNHNFLLTAVLTDYSLHSIWVYPEVDRYYTATKEMAAELMRLGFDKDRVFPLGIPVDREKFSNLPPAETARKRLGIDADRKTILIMGGGLGLGGIMITLGELEKIAEPLNIMVAAGKNQDLAKKVQEAGKRSIHRVLAFDYTDKIPLMMRSASILITKPGALTMSEAFLLGTPMLLHEPIPGPEKENALFAVKQGAAFWIKDGTRLTDTVERLLMHQEEMRALSGGAKSCAKPYAARNIAKNLAQIFLLFFRE